ncbi:GntR family transcriptional regulator [Savagea sp. SN6]|uniref:GntR family transcriptional regulator n=1 Tax=Savagea serpentis TaxID=2785297 RepID=A0A8J7G896_9BACL|nr:GntR family transcriptional regulator [Savagea serpentis]MBF4499994.1 GntR family transcriptional regulator [Savagea serpentis]
MVKIDQRHLYVQVIEKIKQDIEDGVYQENERFPSEFELARSLGVSRATLREAFRILEEEKVIVRKHGVGTFVSSKPLFHSGIEQLASVSTMIRNAGMEPGTIYKTVDHHIVNSHLAPIFECDLEEEIVTIKRVRTADGEPVVYCIDHALSRHLSLDGEGIYNDSLFDSLELNGQMKIVQAVAEIVPLGYDEEASAILRCGIDVPLLVLIQRHYNEEGQVVLYSTNYFRADKFQFQVVRKRV